ncbi:MULTISPECIES: hypothetical protein [Pseudomonadaceae]|uniref:hypothetical protein n=1 Tax=Pseudomonadaceae TaxID=135621 RepID=UPI00210D29DF|nr:MULTISPECIES: hypothetical protein [Pseudomonadaceae]MCQ4261017.1 hypothetical protein [Stutzerimonas stutzeri]
MFKLSAVLTASEQRELAMDAMSIAWVVMGGSFGLVLVLTIGLWLQWLHTQQYQAELSVLRGLVQSLGEIIRRLESEKAELAAGLRAEKGQVEHLKGQLFRASR